MQREVERLVLVRRFTTLVGETTFRTKPLRIRRYASANLIAWAGAGTGTDPLLVVRVQQSDNLTDWEDLGDDLEPEEGEAPGSFEFTQEWLRLELILSGTNPAITCWVAGEFVLRAMSETAERRGGRA